MKNFTALVSSISLSKAEFAYATGVTPYRLRTLIHKSINELKKRGYSQYDKVLMPPVVSYLLQKYGLELHDEQMQNILRGIVGTIK